MSDEEYFAMRREEEARKPQYDPDKDYFWRFDCWLGETLETSDKWFADPVILICILLVLVNL
jgi:hypothetical protein